MFRVYGKLDKGQGALAYGGTLSAIYSSSQESDSETGVGSEVHTRPRRF